MSKYQTTIGLEIHAELNTHTKMFCDCINDPDEKHPNINICPICMGHPGTLPVINKEAVKKVLMVGVALNCKLAEFSKFDRKNYFYPDLPKGYQISQYDLPLCQKGFLEIKTSEGEKKIRITRIHLEEDAGRLSHPVGAEYTLVDYNRAGVPLMELVTEPDLKTSEDVKKFAQELQLILKYVNASEANMEKGEMRVEVNISLASEGSDKLGTKVEVKNINSVSAAARAVEYEIKRQSEILDDGGKIIQETRGWDENKGETFSQRMKEGSADYRYFPEPDLPPLRFDDNITEDIRASLPELPAQRRERFKDYGLNDSQIEIFTISKHLGNYYEAVASELDLAAKAIHQKRGIEDEVLESHLSGKLHALSANYMITEFPPMFNLRSVEIDNVQGINISAEAFAELMVLIYHKEISSTGAKIILKEMAETGLHPEHIIQEKGLSQVSDEASLQVAIAKIIDNNPKAVEDYKKGKEESLKFLIGQIMRETKGKANPEVAEKLLRQMMDEIV